MKRLIYVISCIIYLFMVVYPLKAQFIDLEDQIVGYFPFNGSADDKTGNGNDGFINGATLCPDRFGNPNSAFRFDGRTQSIRIPFGATIDFTQRSAYSISLWIRPRDINSGCILFKNYDYGIKWGGLKDACTIYSGVASSFMKTNFSSWKTNDWYNLVIVQEQSQVSLYINGKLDFFEAKTHQTANQSEDIYIGRHPYFWGAFEGEIDDICIFSRALDKMEVEALYQIETMPLEVVPKTQYPEVDPQVLSGTWQGIFSQPGNDLIDNYAFWLEIEVEGKQIKGFTRTEIAKTDAYGVMSFSGRVASSSANIKEERIIREYNPTGLDWCMKFAKLRFNPDDQSLRGRWLADNCKETGEMILFKSEIAFNYNKNRKGDYASLEELAGILEENKRKSRSEKVSVVNRKIDISPINFVTASYQLTKDSRDYLLSRIIPFLREALGIKLRISGHTDNIGDDGFNLQLSIKRAEAVARFLSQNGIEQNRLEYEGFGEAKPISANDTPEGRLKNRRVEMEIISQ